MRVVDNSVLVVYLLAVLAFGLYAGRSNKTASDYATGGGRLPAWALGLSIFGTYVSAFSFLALPGKAFDTNWNAFAFSLAIPVIALLVVKWVVPFYRKLGSISAYEHFENRFGPWARVYAVVCYLLIQLGRMGGILYLLAVALAPITGASIPALILVAAAVVIVYTFFGGMKAVVWTDVLQSVILIAGAIACAILIPSLLPEGTSVLDKPERFSLGSLDPDLVQSTFWVVLLFGLFENLRNFAADQSYVQRYQSAHDDKAAVRTVWIGALLYLPVSAVFLFIGTALASYYGSFPDELEPGLTGDKVFPYFIATALPVGVCGLLIAAVSSAAQSTVSSSLNCGATLLLNDVYLRFVRPDADEKHALVFVRITTVLLGLLGAGAALAMINIKSALDVWWKIAGVFGAGILGLYLLGRLTKATSLQAVVATVVGVFVIAGHTYYPQLHPFMTIVLGTCTILLVGAVLARFGGSRRKEA